jgi:hypothetical protein
MVGKQEWRPVQISVVAAVNIRPVTQEELHHLRSVRLDRHMERLGPTAPEGMRPDHVHERRAFKEQRFHGVEIPRADEAEKPGRESLRDGLIPLPSSRDGGVQGAPARKAMRARKRTLRIGESSRRMKAAKIGESALGALPEPFEARTRRQGRGHDNLSSWTAPEAGGQAGRKREQGTMWEGRGAPRGGVTFPA